MHNPLAAHEALARGPSPVYSAYMDHTTKPAFEPFPDRVDPTFCSLMLGSAVACLRWVVIEAPRVDQFTIDRARAIVEHFDCAMGEPLSPAEVERTVAHVRDAVAGTEHEFKEPTP